MARGRQKELDQECRRNEQQRRSIRAEKKEARNAAGIQQGCSRNVAKKTGAAADTQGERNRNSAGLHQERSKNDRGRSRNAAGQQERSKNDQGRSGNAAGT